jgi:hypothetical protein
MAVLNVQLAERGSHSCCEVGTPLLRGVWARHRETAGQPTTRPAGGREAASDRKVALPRQAPVVWRKSIFYAPVNCKSLIYLLSFMAVRVCEKYYSLHSYNIHTFHLD